MRDAIPRKMAMTRIIIFAKAPLAGFAKTRMIPLLGAEGAANLAWRMLDSTLASAISAQLGLVELCVTPDKDHPAWRDVAIPECVVVTTQEGGDLGERLARAAQRRIACGESVLLIGTDCVEMSASLLREASAKLRQVDAVIHTTVDGGYALLGLGRFHASVFSPMAWGTHAVASETIRRMEQLGWSIFRGATLHDIDEPQDLQFQGLPR